MSPKTHRNSLKQTNKIHKTGRHKSKGALASVQKGKINKQIIKSKNIHSLSKVDRKHHAQQLRKIANDMDAVLKKRYGGLNGTPHLVAVVPLNVSFNPQRALNLLSNCDATNTVTTSTVGAVNISSKRYKARYSFVLLPNESEALSFAELDLIRVSNTVLFLVSATTGPFIDDVGLEKIKAIKAQGLPTTVIACMDIKKFRVKEQQDIHQVIQTTVSDHFVDEKVYDLDNDSDALNILRRISEQKQKTIPHRDHRAHMLIEDAVFISEKEAFGMLKVTGFLRGAPLNVNGLVHIPGIGNFQMEKIEQLQASTPKSNATDVITSNPDLQTSLVFENIPDPMNAEQTWPTAEELNEASLNSEATKKTKLIKKVPKGMSDYQAVWIPDIEEVDVESDCSTENDSDHEMECVDENIDEDDQESEYEEEEEIIENTDKYDDSMNFKTEAEDLELLKAASADMQFPDEMDTPQNIDARIRFQKYRGLESFRTSHWDKKENLPLDYARIFQFQNYDRTRRKILKSDNKEEGLVNPGSYVAITLLNVPNSAKLHFDKLSIHPLILIGMLPHEHKMCIVNAKLQQVNSYNNNEPIKSKERLLIQCGYRRFYAEPIFSEHTNGSKFKFERFFQPDATVAATFFAPIQFAPAPILVYRIMTNNSTRLVATGNLITCDPDRIVLKRIVLSGHPFKVNKRSAVIRFMFFNREDIAYFKPCKLRTRLGKTGHIKEPLGTHGHMKCVFNEQLNSQDTVFLNLYKRIFPKYNYEEYKLGINDIDQTSQVDEKMTLG